MNVDQVMSRLEANGTAQNRKVYARHGVRSELFGVSSANLGKLKREVGTDSELARALWLTGNHDARIFATMVADPASMPAAVIDRWVKDLDDAVLTAAFAGVVARAPVCRARMKKWTAAKHEWTACAGWNVLKALVGNEAGLPESELLRQLGVIEATIHTAPNHVRCAMNDALISIAVTCPSLRDEALEAARAIGRVEIDHGETGCKTPDALATIEKTLAQRARKADKSGKAERRASGPEKNSASR